MDKNETSFVIKLIKKQGFKKLDLFVHNCRTTYRVQNQRSELTDRKHLTQVCKIGIIIVNITHGLPVFPYISTS